MADVWSDDGCDMALTLLLKTEGAGLDGARVHLGKANIIPDTGTSLATLAAQEATFPGYGSVVLDDDNWDDPAVAAHVATSDYNAAVEFVCTGGGSAESCYYWYITNGANTVLYCAGVLTPGPLLMQNNGDTISLALTATERSS